MRRRAKLLSIISLLITGILGVVVCGGSSSALSFQSNNEIQFTFNPTIQINMSGNLTITDLVPGGIAIDSNIIDITVATNAGNGFTLTSTVGNNTTAYNSTSLKNGNFSFSPVASLTNALASIDNNKWGYNYSTDNGTTWAGYDALPLYSEAGAELYDTNSAANQTVKFKIGAKAGSNQASGEYTNVINFIAVTKVVEEGVVCNPSGTTIATNSSTGIKCMQDISSTNKSSILTSMTEDAQYQLTDNRDNKTYYIAKLKDGNIWMTQNLDLDLETTPTNVAALTSANTDLPNGTTWTPSSATLTTSGQNNSSTTTPESYDPGNLYWSGTPEDSTTSSTGDAHYHLGNYYNWTAAVAMNNSSGLTINGTNADQSICPAGWTLPLADRNTGSKSFYNLVSQYDWYEKHGSMEGDYESWGAPLYFPLSGIYWSSGEVLQIGGFGRYWSSMVHSSDDAYNFYSDDYHSAYPDDVDDRSYVVSVRCVAR